MGPGRPAPLQPFSDTISPAPPSIQGHPGARPFDAVQRRSVAARGSGVGATTTASAAATASANEAAAS